MVLPDITTQGDKIHITVLKAFDEFYYKYRNKVYSFIFCFLKDPDKTEEFVQDVFISMWEKRCEIKTSNQFDQHLILSCYRSLLPCFEENSSERKVLEYLMKKSPINISENLGNIKMDDLLVVVNRLTKKSMLNVAV